MPLPPDTAPRDGALLRLWFRSTVEPVIGYWSKAFYGWASYFEPVRIHHGLTGWEAVDQAAVIARQPPNVRRRIYKPPSVVVGQLPNVARPAMPKVAPISSIVIAKSPRARTTLQPVTRPIASSVVVRLPEVARRATAQVALVSNIVMAKPPRPKTSLRPMAGPGGA
jgi:hypothetical protein